jgi:hypothetical protein
MVPAVLSMQPAVRKWKGRVVVSGIDKNRQAFLTIPDRRARSRGRGPLLVPTASLFKKSETCCILH